MLNRPSPAFVAACLLLSTALPGCGSKAPVADADLEIAAPAEQRLIALTDLDQRVARVGYRLSIANAELCPTVRNSAGWLLHAASQYSPELRPWAETRFGLDGDLPGLLAVPEGSAAALAGLRRGDLLLRVNGQAMTRGVTRRAAAFEGVEANIQQLDLALAAGPVEVAFRRDGNDQTATVTPQRACGYDVQLDPSDELNARADGKRLFITTAMAGFTATDDELALVLGHELAHHVLAHRGWHEAEIGAARPRPCRPSLAQRAGPSGRRTASASISRPGPDSTVQSAPPSGGGSEPSTGASAIRNGGTPRPRPAPAPWKRFRLRSAPAGRRAGLWFRSDRCLPLPRRRRIERRGRFQKRPRL